MTATSRGSAPAPTSSKQLRHDLLNALNVLLGATSALRETELTQAQRAWVQIVAATTDRLMAIADNVESYEENEWTEGQARLADLCSIAAARVGKPFDRERLVQALEQVGGRRPLRILLVDDSPELVLLVRTYLRGTNCTIDVVESGEWAVSKAQSEPYDVILMDIDLPGLDGATAAHAIRAAELARGASPTPIIAMTAFDLTGAADERVLRGEVASPAEFGGAGAGPEAADPDVVRIDDPEIAPLVPEFLSHRRAEIAGFREALRVGAFGAIQSSAHKMKGSGRGYGLTVISRLGAELEIAAHQQDTDRIARLIDDLDGYLSRVKIVT